MNTRRICKDSNLRIGSTQGLWSHEPIHCTTMLPMLPFHSFVITLSQLFHLGKRYAFIFRNHSNILTSLWIILLLKSFCNKAMRRELHIGQIFPIPMCSFWLPFPEQIAWGFLTGHWHGSAGLAINLDVTVITKSL